MSSPNAGDLIKAKTIREDDVDAAVDAYMIGVRGELFALADGYELNLGAAVSARPYATETLAKDGATDAQKRNAVKTAILLAVPTKAP